MSRKECWLSLIFKQESEKIKPEARVCEIQGKKGKGYKSSNAKSEFLNNTCTTEKQNL